MPTEAQTQVERARQAEPAWQQSYRQRTRVEHGIRGLTRLRDRTTHYGGREKTEMQVVWQAVGYNIHTRLQALTSPHPGAPVQAVMG